MCPPLIFTSLFYAISKLRYEVFFGKKIDVANLVIYWERMARYFFVKWEMKEKKRNTVGLRAR